MSTAEEEIDRVFAAADLDSGKHLETKWIMGVVMLADVLLHKDELEREKLLNGLWREIRDALVGIPKIMQTGKLN
jgi:hypothetical protein